MGASTALPAASPGRSLSCSRHRLCDSKPGRRLWQLDCTGWPATTMQPLEVGLVPAPARDPRLTRWLRRGSGILAHLVALGFTIFLIALSRPGTSECARRGGTREGGGTEVLDGQLLGAVEGGPGTGEGQALDGLLGRGGRAPGSLERMGLWVLGVGDDRRLNSPN